MPSTVIRSFAYDEATRRLRVRFQSGKRYIYLDVPPETCAALKRAFAKGEYFNAHIREQFAFERDTSPDDEAP